MKYLNAANRVSENRRELIYVLLDHSASMSIDDYKPTRLEGALQANIKLIETKAKLHPKDELGIIAFDDSAYVVSKHIPVGHGSQTLCHSIRDNIKAGGGTDFTGALVLAENCMFDSVVKLKPKGTIESMFRGFFFEQDENHAEHRYDAPSQEATLRIIMLTDGDHCGGGSPLSVASRLKNKGAIIECIGIAGRREEVNEELLRQIASIDENGEARYYFIGDSKALLKKYESMANQIRPV